MSLVCVVTIKWCNSVVVCTLCICRVFVFHVFCIMTEHSSSVSDLCNSCISWISVAASIHDNTTCTFIKLSFYDWKVLGFLISSFTCIKVIGKWVYFISSLLCKVQSFFVHETQYNATVYYEVHFQRYCKPTFIRVWEISARLARASSLRTFLAVNQSLSYGC